MQIVVLQFGKAPGRVLPSMHHYERAAPGHYQIDAHNVTELTESVG